MKIAKPRRVTRSYVQTIAGTPEEIMPLYCPVREAEWCAGWDPVVVYSESGVVEPDCVFVTGDGTVESAWFVTRYEPATGRVEITSQNHGFAVAIESLKDKDIEVTHINLNDDTLEGFRHHSLPIFAVQYHPEASPGPHDAMYLFDEFIESMKQMG